MHTTSPCSWLIDISEPNEIWREELMGQPRKSFHNVNKGAASIYSYSAHASKQNPKVMPKCTASSASVGCLPVDCRNILYLYHLSQVF